MNDRKRLIQESREKFIASKLEHEAWIAQLFKQIEGKDFTSIENAPTGRTAQEIFPSLYTEEFSLDDYSKEKQQFLSWYDKLLEYTDGKAIEALRRIGK